MLMRFYYTAPYDESFEYGGRNFSLLLSWRRFKRRLEHKSLTEDVGFSIQQICKGNKILPARKARFYDEQPSTLDVSLKQRSLDDRRVAVYSPVFFPQL